MEIVVGRNSHSLAHYKQQTGQAIFDKGSNWSAVQGCVRGMHGSL